MGVQKATVCRVLDAVLDCLVNVASEWIALPTSRDQLAEIKVGFYQKRQFPGVIGCVDGTHVAIRTPPRNEDVFVCRKGFHSINVMLINDHKNRITAVSARFPGSAHDMAVFDCSNIQQRMENGDLQNKGLLLADSGYALRPYLMTPVLRPHNDQEVRYNAAHKGTRVSIEQVNGILKSRFRCLDMYPLRRPLH
ncbi:PREDICTED: putative nuclease HARBI1 [Priapulus caudatus]|uniref:Putative nuclease HARBI1 n=1 Tax=Priapulus caudatus TaxID=37621 RepID=A0ABM1EC30_PRICU|nr:PREDICTED: putative nuclease HARBI1 [Priapulus caudatus]